MKLHHASLFFASVLGACAAPSGRMDTWSGARVAQ
jgi:hypothetical protein